MPLTISRRNVLVVAALAAAGGRTARARQSTPAPSGQRWTLPIRTNGEIPGDGFIIRHGFASENTWFNPGWWHTAEDWYRAGNGETAGAEVLAASDGEVVWIGSEYPGLVVLILHTNGLYGMYGHLDHSLDVAVGYRVVAGQVIGRVLQWTDGRAPSHLHFELRNFLQNSIVNGDAPAYAVGCGYQCPPGPGYWPINDGRHPSALGWRNPSHVIAQGMTTAPPKRVAVAVTVDGMVVTLHAAPDDHAETVARPSLRAGDRFALLEITAGAADSAETSALGYQVWYQIQWPNVGAGWVRALTPDVGDIGSDGRPSSLRPVMLPTTTEDGA